jgi:multidrug efflux system membrane fusion protein
MINSRLYPPTVSACLAAALFFLPSCKRGKKEPQDAAKALVAVKVAAAVEEDFPVHYNTVGQLASPASVKVTTQVSGILEKVHFSEGDLVKKGELLFSIDDRPYTAALKKAQASIAKANSDVNVAQLKVERSRGLVDQKFISAQDFDTLKQTVVSAQSELEVSKMEVDIANIQLDYTKIEAPISGKTGILQVQQGNLAEQGSDNYLTSIVQLDPLYVDFMIPAGMGGKVKKSFKKNSHIIKINPAEEAVGTQGWLEGTLEFIDNQVDSKSGTLKLRGSIPNKEGMFWPGQFISVSLTLDVLEKAVVIPTTAIRARGSGAFVYLLDKGNIAKVQAVELGPRNEDSIAVISGLKAGDQVITEGQVGLRDGSEVKLVEPAKATAKEKESATK